MCAAHGMLSGMYMSMVCAQRVRPAIHSAMLTRLGARAAQLEDENRARAERGMAHVSLPIMPADMKVHLSARPPALPRALLFCAPSSQERVICCAGLSLPGRLILIPHGRIARIRLLSVFSSFSTLRRFSPPFRRCVPDGAGRAPRRRGRGAGAQRLQRRRPRLPLRPRRRPRRRRLLRGRSQRPLSRPGPSALCPVGPVSRRPAPRTLSRLRWPAELYDRAGGPIHSSALALILSVSAGGKLARVSAFPPAPVRPSPATKRATGRGARIKARLPQGAPLQRSQSPRCAPCQTGQGPGPRGRVLGLVVSSLEAVVVSSLQASKGMRMRYEVGGAGPRAAVVWH